MWTRTYSKVFQNVEKDRIWHSWQDVENWPQWDKELEYCKMQGSFKNNENFILKPKGGPKVKIILSDIILNKQFTTACKFLGASMIDEHKLEDTPEGLRIIHNITVRGILSLLWVKLVAQDLFNSLPEQMENLVKYSRS